MMQSDKTWEYQGYLMRSSRIEDMEEYYIQGFCRQDDEGIRMTGSKNHYTKEEVTTYFQNCLHDPNRYDFLIFAPDGTMIGESVINEIDWESRSANFRIYLFSPTMRGKGIGFWAICKTRDFAFESLHLHRLSLNVFAFNEHAYKAYLKAGYREEGRLRDAIWDKTQYADDILMSILEDEWKESHNSDTQS